MVAGKEGLERKKPDTGQQDAAPWQIGCFLGSNFEISGVNLIIISKTFKNRF